MTQISFETSQVRSAFRQILRPEQPLQWMKEYGTSGRRFRAAPTFGGRHLAVALCALRCAAARFRGFSWLCKDTGAGERANIMISRLTRVAFGVVWLVGLLSQPAWSTEVFLGQIQSASNGVVTIRTKGKNLSFVVAPEATIIRNAKRVKLEDLKQNDRAEVTTDNRMAALVIEARS